MDEQSTFGFQDLLTVVIGNMANAVSERPGESQAQRFARSQAAIHMTMGMLPRDVTEVMLAGHCMMLHEVLTAEVREVLCAEAATNRRTLIALNKAFNDNLNRLERYQQRPAEGQRDATDEPSVADIPPAQAEPALVRPCGPDRPAPPPGMNRAARRQASRAQMREAAAASRAASRQAGQAPPAIAPAAAAAPGWTAPEPPGTGTG